MSFRADSTWATRKVPEIKAIITRHLDTIISIRTASQDEDKKMATDMVVEVSAGTIAVRVRDTTRDFRDWTLRIRRDSGVETELSKIKRGFARWYLYAWCSQGGPIGDYVLIDLEKVRESGLLDRPRRERTADGWHTTFVAIPVDELRQAGVLVADNCQSPCTQPQPGYIPNRSVKNT